MANAKVRSWTNGKFTALFALLLALVCGLAYLGTEDDWNLKTASKPQALLQKPPEKQAKRPQAGILPPSFDIAAVDERGHLVAAGRSPAGWTVQIKSKSQILGETKADENNEWVITPEALLPPGDHDLSLLTIDPLGTVKVAARQESRVTVPAREMAGLPQQKQKASAAPAPSPSLALTSHAGQDAGKEGCVTALVKSGDTLWQIAHHCYGSGTKYTKIFRSNRSLIRNPDLIYPEQRFALPR